MAMTQDHPHCSKQKKKKEKAFSGKKVVLLLEPYISKGMAPARWSNTNKPSPLLRLSVFTPRVQTACPLHAKNPLVIVQPLSFKSSGCLQGFTALQSGVPFVLYDEGFLLAVVTVKRFFFFQTNQSISQCFSLDLTGEILVSPEYNTDGIQKRGRYD